MDKKQIEVTIKHIDHAIKSLNKCGIDNKEHKLIKTQLLLVYDMMLDVEKNFSK